MPGLKPLKQRLSLEQQLSRARKQMARRNTADKLMEAAGYAVHQSTELKRRGLFGRLKLVLTGK